MPLYLIGYLVPAMMALLAVPVMLGKVPPNAIFGFRTPKTMSSRAIWYAAKQLLVWMAGAAVVSVVLASVLSLLYLRQL